MEADSGASAELRRRAAAELVARVKDSVGVSVAIAVTDPDTLERSLGKMRRVIDERPASVRGHGG